MSTEARPRQRRPSGGAHEQRRAARLAAVQALYQIELSGEAPEAVIAEFARFRLGRTVDEVDPGPADKALFADIVRGVSARRQELDNMIAAVLAENWTVERLEIPLCAILRAGTYELAERPDVPARAAIAEYVGLAADFFSGKELGLVNAILDRLGAELRPGELERGKSGGAATAG